MTVHDWRHRQANPPITTKAKQKHALDKHGRVVVRDPKAVRGIVVHQTACVFGQRKDQPDRYHRAFGVACHALAFNDGVVVLPNPLPWLVWHGNGFNDESLGLEIEGRYPGLVGHPETLASTPETPVTEAVVESARLALRTLVTLGRAEGMPIELIWAHRQSSPTRRSDPGEALWRALVVDYAVPVLGLAVEPERILRTRKGEPGRPIPEMWGGRHGTPY